MLLAGHVPHQGILETHSNGAHELRIRNPGTRAHSLHVRVGQDKKWTATPEQMRTGFTVPIRSAAGKRIVLLAP